MRHGRVGDIVPPGLTTVDQLVTAGYSRGDAQAVVEFRRELVAAGASACRVCGCTDASACPDGCWWVESDLCSGCAVVAEDELLAAVAAELAAARACCGDPGDCAEGCA